MAEPVPDPGGGLVRLRMRVRYDGTPFHGWARQSGLPTIQESVEDAIATVLHTAGVATTVAGRTDAGVHATGQVVHVDVPHVLWVTVGQIRFLRGVNAILPPEIRISAVAEAPMTFDARFAALWRRYRYTVTDDPAGVSPLQRHRVLWVPRPLDVDAMDSAVGCLVGEHDFLAFCKPRRGGSTVRRVLECRWHRADPFDTSDQSLIHLDIRADAFCHSMVRSIVGASLLVGRGTRDPQWLATALATPSRSAGVPVAPPRGLVLVEVGYPDDAAGFADRARITKSFRMAPG